MSRPSPKDDTKGLRRLVQLATLGSAIIIIVYSVYYYRDANRFAKTNIFDSSETESIEYRSAYENVILEKNLIISALYNAAVNNSIGDFKATTPSKLMLDLNPKTSVCQSGLQKEGFEVKLQQDLQLKFHSSPPITSVSAENINVRGIHFEHFPIRNATVHWRDSKDQQVYFILNVDSVKGRFKTLNNQTGFEFQDVGQNERIQVINTKIGADIKSVLDSIFYDANTSISNMKMPIVDFDFYAVKNAEIEFVNSVGEKKLANKVEVETKILIGPNLKYGKRFTKNANKNTKQLEIKLPFLVALYKKDKQQPYLILGITNNELLLK